MTVIAKEEEEEEKGNEPLIGTIFGSGKGAINPGPKSVGNRETEGQICTVIIG